MSDPIHSLFITLFIVIVPIYFVGIRGLFIRRLFTCEHLGWLGNFTPYEIYVKVQFRQVGSEANI